MYVYLPVVDACVGESNDVGFLVVVSSVATVSRSLNKVSLSLLRAAHFILFNFIFYFIQVFSAASLSVCLVLGGEKQVEKSSLVVDSVASAGRLRKLFTSWPCGCSKCTLIWTQ